MGWTARGVDNGLNYTLGVCLSPLKKSLQASTAVKDADNVSAVGAYYIEPQLGQYISLGEFATTPVYRGRKLTLQYDNGLYCDALKHANGERLRRRTILQFTCDREMLTRAHATFVTSVDDCVYLFEIRSHYACPTAAQADNLAAIWIFVLILLAALMVYFLGGFLYKMLKRSRHSGAKV